MARFVKLLILLTIVFPAPLGATENEAPTKPERRCDLNPETLFKRSFDFKDMEAKEFPIEIPVASFRPDDYPATADAAYVGNVKRGPESGSLLLKISRPPDGVTQDDWQKSVIYGIGRIKVDTEKTSPKTTIVHMAVREKTADTMLLDTTLPRNPDRKLSNEWLIVPVLCGGAVHNKILGFASVEVVVVSISWAFLGASLLILVFWLTVSAGAYQLYKKKVDQIWKIGEPFSKDPRNHIARLLGCMNPVFISQDSLGYGSMSRFQILFFTTVVGWVLTYFFLHSGALSNLSDTILLLLGITVTGGTFARAASDWTGISPESRRWLKGTPILKTDSERPRFADLLQTQGEMDVAKIQALLFTFLIGVNIVASGLSGLGAFTLPPQIVYLSLISQSALVFGKLLPTDTRQQVETDLKALRLAAADVRSTPGDPTVLERFAQAKNAAKETLRQTYADLFDDDAFDAVTADAAQVV